MEETVEAKLKPFVISGNDALEFKLVRNTEDLEDDETSFKPEMSHQIFGDSELVFGYKDLKIKLYYSAGSLETYLGMTYSEIVTENMCEDVKPDEVLPKIVEVLSPKVHNNMDFFIKSLSKDKTFQPAGEMIYSCSIHDGEVRTFEVYKADMSYKNFKEYHTRLQTFLLWYVDAASFIDIDDDHWNYFNMFERYKAEDGSIRYATVGFATVYQYYAYPDHTRPRIAQFLILPPFQRIGLGSELLKAIYREYTHSDKVKDITVESPSVHFQRLRDFVDCSNCSTLATFSKENLMKSFNKSMALEAKKEFKINEKQSRRVYEILRLKTTDVSDPMEYREYRMNVKKRLIVPYKKEDKDFRKIQKIFKDNGEQGGHDLPVKLQAKRIELIEKEYRALETEYKKVIKRLNNSNC